MAIRLIQTFQCRVGFCFVFCVFLSGYVYCQTQHSPSASVDKKELADAISRVKSGNFNGYHVGLIDQARATEAIPDLEIQFARTTDPLDKAKIAQTLLALGDKKDTYWNFLAELANPILNSNAPNPFQVDAQGKVTRGLSPQFSAWAESQGKSPNEAGEDAIYVYPGVMLLLGGTEDPRAVPLLRQALSLPNDLIEANAAMGLAQLGDEESIPLIIAACERLPTESASVMARALAYFDDPEAQKAVDRYVPSDEAKALRERKAQGKKPLSK